ncbi:MAG TPA: hypothetical protein DIU06_00465 [Rhodospirillaceae bacterium]|nr:hypothetical protein [Rhodospirillaceae bacterium]
MKQKFAGVFKMREQYKKPVHLFRGHIRNIIKKFIHHDGITVDPETGIMHMPQGAARLYYNEPTHSVGLIFSKDSHNLTGEITDAKLKRCYHIADYPLEGEPDDFERYQNLEAIQNDLIADLDALLVKHKDRMTKHFTLYEVRQSHQSEAMKNAGLNIDSDTYIFTNNNYIYTVNRNKQNKWEVRISVSTRRADGSFVPFNLTDTGLKAFFNKTSSRVATTNTLDEAMDELDQHWGLVASNTWDEGNAYDVVDKKFKLTASFKLRTNKIVASLPKRLFTTGATGTTVGLISAKYTLPAALVAAGSHTLYDMAFDEVYEEGNHRLKRSQNKTLDDYGLGENRTDYFRIQTKEEIAKLLAHIDPLRLPARGMAWVDFNDLNLLSNGMKQGKYTKAGTLEELTTYMHQRGISSRCCFYDDNTVVHRFQNGVMRVQQYDRATQSYNIYAQYRPELCKNKNVALPKFYADQFKDDKIIAFQFKKSPETFAKGLQGRTRFLDKHAAVEEIYHNVDIRTLDDAGQSAYEIIENLEKTFGLQDCEYAPGKFTTPAPPSERNLGKLGRDKGYEYAYLRNPGLEGEEEALAALIAQRHREANYRAAAQNTYDCLPHDQIATYEHAYTRM